MYGIVHWPLLTNSYKLKAHVENVSVDKEALKLIETNESLKKLFDELPTISEKIQTSGWALMGQASRLRLYGLSSVLLSIFAFLCRPRWVGFIAIPFGAYALNLSMIIM